MPAFPRGHYWQYHSGELRTLGTDVQVMLYTIRLITHGYVSKQDQRLLQVLSRDILVALGVS